MPTGPVAAVTTARRLRTSPACCSLTTAATAVVFDPFESSMTETRIGPKNVSRTTFSNRSPAAMSVPPMKIAVLCRSFGPRVKMAPCTWSRTVSSVTPLQLMISSAPPSYATTRSKTLGLAEVSSCKRSLRMERKSREVRLKPDPTSGDFVRSGPPDLPRRFYLGLKGCLAVFEPEMTSFTAGLLASARWIDSLVAW